ncbi:MAG TPA: GNAT family N-acetyltransferase [Thermomonospora sp.]|nr:GNAT family N-acetyltransferase [Thermomonospora sp.]
MLRAFTPDDLDDAFAYQSDPEVTRFLYWDPRTREEVVEVLDRKSRQAVLDDGNDYFVLAVVWREAGRLVGEVSLNHYNPGHRQGEIGFIFNPAYHGKGLAREAAEVVLRLGFDDLGLHRIIGRCDARNTASARLMERLGMRREAHFRENEIFKGEWGSEFVYALLAGQTVRQGAKALASLGRKPASSGQCRRITLFMPLRSIQSMPSGV